MSIFSYPRFRLAMAVLLGWGGLQSIAAAHADSPPVPAAVSPTYADLADLADAAPLVVRAMPRKISRLEPARAPGLKAGRARLYIEARTEALVAGRAPLGEALRFLVDVPLDAKGKVPKLKKQSMVLFARLVPGRAGELQLIAPDAWLLWDPALDGRLRAVLAELLAPGAPPRITGVREAIHVSGNLAGEGETQLFLATADDQPAAITVNRSPGQPPRWSVSFSEVLDQSGGQPQRDTLAWYRLACFLRPQLPGDATVSGSAAERVLAAVDYRYVLSQLGACPRTSR